MGVNDLENERQNNRSSVQSLDRAFLILETLSNYSRGVYLTDLANELDLHVSTVHRLLTAMAQHGYVQKESNSGKYRLTMRMYEIGSRVVSGTALLDVTKPYLERLADLSGEVVHFVVPQDDDVVYLYKTDSLNSFVRMGSSVGLHNPLYCTGVGKAILATWSDAEVAAYCKRTAFVRFTNKTITTNAKMQREIAKIRQLHYAIDDEEHELGVKCLGVPILNSAGRAVAAMSISAPVQRMTQEEIDRYVPQMIASAREISGLLGHIDMQNI